MNNGMKMLVASQMQRKRGEERRYTDNESRYNAYPGHPPIYYNRMPPDGWPDRMRGDDRREMTYDENRRRIGFGENDRVERDHPPRIDDDMPEMRRRRDRNGRYMGDYDGSPEMRSGNVSYFPGVETQMHHGESQRGEKVEAGGTFWMIPPSGKQEKLTREKAEKWVRSMRGDDPKSRGEMWSYEDAKLIAKEHGIPTEGQEMIDYYVALNMVYTDFSHVAKKHDVDNEDYYADMACAWLYDPDAKPPTEKLMAYKKYVIPHREE